MEKILVDKTYYESDIVRLKGPKGEQRICSGIKKSVNSETIEQKLQEMFMRSDQPMEKKIRARTQVFMYLHSGATVTIDDKAYSYE